MAPLFFPKSVDAATAAAGARGAGAAASYATQVQFWAVFSLTFLARPFGGVLFAAIADLKGRKPSLMLSVACMGIASLLIGCLPTAQHIGVAAPVLLCILRFAQGLALGGEFAAALVAAFELAPVGGKNFGGTVAYIASTVGTMLGVVVPLVVVTALQDNTPGLLLWGWRLPFLLSVVAALAALALRSMMVEPDVIIEAIARDRREAAALDAASEAEAEAEAAAARGGAAEGGGGGGVDGALAGTDATATAPAATGGLLPRLLHRRGAGANGSGSSGELAAAANHPRRHHPRHHRTFPLIPILRHHWRAVLLQCLYTAMGTGTSVVYTGWLGLSLLAPPAMLPRALAYGSSLVALAVSAVVGLIFARLILDAGCMRPLHLALIGIVLSAAVAPVVFIVGIPQLALSAQTSAGAQTGIVLVLAVCVSQAAFLFASLSASMSRLYPPNLRVSGFSLAHNVATSIFGGLSPVFLTAIQAKAPMRGPAAYMGALSAVSAVACVLLFKLYPRTNMLPAEAAEADAREAAGELGGGAADGKADADGKVAPGGSGVGPAAADEATAAAAVPLKT